MTILYVLIGVVVVVALWMIGVFNKLIKMRNRTNEAWADIDVQLKRRYDLIPNLVNTVKGYATHEDSTFTKITEARTAAMSSNSIEEQGKAENMLSGALKSLFAVTENYPDLKANQNFLELQKELSDTENKIQASRRFYNGNVRDMNTAIETFPNSFVAGMFSFTKHDFFELETGSEAKENVEVKF